MSDHRDCQVKLLELREVANWQLEFKDASKDWVDVKVPTFQRGLVWNAAQIEVLWDSLLRGIPIGSFSLLPMKGGKNFEKNVGEMKDDGYWLLDGQQRSNAIALGYADFPGCKSSKEEEKTHAVLWIDLLPDAVLKKRSNRKYFFYVTTEGRPWGYEISDANGENRAGKVPPKSYRYALEEISSDTVRPPLRDLWPVSATLPVPFCVFRKWAEKTDASTGLVSFLDGEVGLSRLRWYQHLKSTKYWAEDRESIERIAGNIKEALLRTREIRILAMVAPMELSQDISASGKSEDEKERDSEIAVYFARLNKSGTLPSKEDLNYSILKSANPALGRLDDIAKNLMHPARLADLAMRVFKSSKSQGSHAFIRSVSRRDAFSLGIDPRFIEYVTRKASFEALGFENEFTCVNQWLAQCLPPVLMAQLARDTPNLYQFLILLAGMPERVTSFDNNQMTALVTLLAWFGNDGSLNYPALYKSLQEKDNDVIQHYHPIDMVNHSPCRVWE